MTYYESFNPTWSNLTLSTSLYITCLITFSMASWIVCYGFMITCSIMAVASE